MQIKKRLPVRAVVPCRELRPSVIRCVEEAMTNRQVASILVTVNGPTPPAEVLARIEGMDSRVHLQIHGQDIGLYRNFRSGVHEGFEYTKFFAEDDSAPPELIDQLVAHSNPSDLLVLPVFSRRQWVNGDFLGPELAHPNVVSAGPTPNLNPSYIFGLWRTDFLIKHWPRRPFDWLDYCLVVRAARANGVRQAPVGPLVLGFTPGRVPHAVNGRNHSSIRAAVELAKIALRTGSFSSLERLSFVGAALAFSSQGCRINEKFLLPKSFYCRLRTGIKFVRDRARWFAARLPVGRHR